MKREFKVGDRVSTSHKDRRYNNKVGIITNIENCIDELMPFWVCYDGGGYDWYKEDELTLIEEDKEEDKEEYFIELNTKRVKEMIDKYKIESPIIKHTKDFRLQKIKDLIKAVNTLGSLGVEIKLKITVEIDGKKVEL